MIDIYTKVAERNPLFIAYYRYGLSDNFYGLLLPYVEIAEHIDLAVDGDKTMNLIFFLEEYECFPFALGKTHEEVFTKIKERTSKFFDGHGNWKIKITHDDEDLSYEEVWGIIKGWYKEAGKKSMGTPFYVIAGKKLENHWLFDALAKEIERVEQTRS